jgi:glycosyltransferase involved in cell wall biosynthesis
VGRGAEPASRLRDVALTRTDAPSIAEAVTPLIITWNEEANLERTLAALAWARRIVVIDSGSTDRTLAIAAADPRVSVVHRPFDDFASQCQFGLAQIDTEWALSLDADYELSPELVAELAALHDDGVTAGYRARFVYRIHCRPLRCSIYPPRTVLYRKALACYRKEGHGHRVAVDGPVRDLKGVIYHDDRKPLARWFASQAKYAALEAEHLLSANRAALPRADRIRLMAWPAPILVFLYVLVAKGCLFDGRAGWFYALQRLLAEILLALELIERRLSSAARRQERT